MCDVIFRISIAQHLDTCEDQEGGKKQKHPFKTFDHRRTDADHDPAQNDDAEDAVNQHPVLVGPGHAKIGEYHRDDEDIVHREALFDDKAGQV